MLTADVAHGRECIALTIVTQQREPITFVRTTFAERLKMARERRGLSQAALARAAGLSAGAIGNYEAGTREQPREVFDLAQALAVEAEWLAKGVGPDPALTAQELLVDYHRQGVRVAHDMRHARNTESLPTIKWEDLMTADLSRPFELEVIDDALAPEIFKGCIALLDPDRVPEPAWPVLVRDRDGNHYLRDYESGPGGRWSAVARARGYAPMDSEAFGLTVIAAMEGYKRPRPGGR